MCQGWDLNPQVLRHTVLSDACIPISTPWQNTDILSFLPILGVKSGMKQATLLFLLKENQILLAMKKRGFGQGRWNGYGGKPNPDENILDTATRETQEEIGVTPKNITQVAILDFYFKNKSEWDQQVLVFITHDWEGEPIESEEMKPEWFGLDKIPYDSMWPDDPLWLPLVLNNKKIHAEFTFGENDIVLDQKVNEIQNF